MIIVWLCLVSLFVLFIWGVARGTAVNDCLVLCACVAQILVDPDDYCLAVPCQFVSFVDLGCSKGHTCQ